MVLFMIFTYREINIVKQMHLFEIAAIGGVKIAEYMCLVKIAKTHRSYDETNFRIVSFRQFNYLSDNDRFMNNGDVAYILYSTQS